MKAIIILFLISLLSSCATVVDPHSKKATVNSWNGDVVWNGEIHQKSFWGRQYEAEKMFTDDKESQELIIKANKNAKISNILIWAGLIGALGYGVDNISNNTYDSSTYWTIFLAGYIPGVIFEVIAQNKVTRAVEGYNKRKGLVLGPGLFQIDHKKRIGLNLNIEF